MNPRTEIDRCCRNCHFCTKLVLTPFGEETQPLSTEERNTLDLSRSSGLNPHFQCAQGIWCYAHGTEERFGEFVDRLRGESCFYTRVKPGVSVDAAKMLQDREAAIGELKRSYRFTQIGLWIAAAALVVSAVSGAIGLLIA